MHKLSAFSTFAVHLRTEENICNMIICTHFFTLEMRRCFILRDAIDQNP